MSAVVAAIIEKSGLSAIFAKTTIERAIRRAGVDPNEMSFRDLERCMPELERSLHAYLGPRATEVIAAIRSLATR